MYMCIYIYICVYVCMYMYRERDRERNTFMNRVYCFISYRGRFLSTSSHPDRSWSSPATPLGKRKKEPINPRFTSRTRSALHSWMQTSTPTPSCLCKPFSSQGCPGRGDYLVFSPDNLLIEGDGQRGTAHFTHLRSLLSQTLSFTR